MREIIQKYFCDPPSDVTYADKNVFNSPTDIKTIAEIEKHLGINFPHDYKDFLLIANGYEGTLGKSYVQFIKVEEIPEFTTMELCLTWVRIGTSSLLEEPLKSTLDICITTTIGKASNV